MNRFKILLILFTLIQSSCSSNSKDGGSQIIIKKFFSLYETKGVESALNYAYSTNSWLASGSREDTQKVIMQLKEFTTKLGKLNGFELLKKKDINERYTVCSYMLMYDRQPLRFTFIFYKPNVEWQLQSFQYDVGMSDESVNSINLSW